MREIDNNLNNVNFKGVQKPVSGEKIQDESFVAPNTDTQREVKDLKNMPELGRTQVAEADSIEKDMKFFAKHPNFAGKLNDIIDQYSQTHTQEETLRFMDTAMNEFTSK